VNTIPTDAEHELRVTHANRADLGILIWRDRDGSTAGRYFSYAETIAVAALLLQGRSVSAAATLVDQSIAVALPYVPGLNTYDLVGEYYLFSLGMVRFSDGSTWEVLADLDIGHAEIAVNERSPLYHAVATRNLAPSSGESIMHRVEQLLTLGRFDGAGRFVQQSEALSIAA
jgi:hypothetical protein